MNFDAKTKQWKVVVTCIVISTTFWFFSALNKDGYVTQLNYPVNIAYDDEKYIATQPLPDELPIEVTGGGWDLMSRFFGLKMPELQLELNATSNQPFIITSSLRSELSSLLEPIALNYFLQDSINFYLEELITRKINIAARKKDWTASMKKDFIIDSKIEVSPNEIIAKGPSSLVNDLPDTMWLVGNENNIESNFSAKVKLPQLPDLVQTNLQETAIHFNVVRLLNIEVNLPIQKIDFPDGNWQTVPEYVPVTYQVSEMNFDVKDSVSIVLKAYFNELTKDSTLILQEEVLSEHVFNVTYRNGNRIKVFRNE